MDKGLAVVIATYFRPDGSTPRYLERALKSIENQSYKNYHIYVIGDNYEDSKGFKEICSRFNQITFVNLPKAIERDKYPFGDYRLFCAGGVNACYYGIELALNDRFEYVCHLDHDDFWEPDHLEKINSVIQLNPQFICTCSTHINNWLPYVQLTGEVYEYYPESCKMITSSACVKYSDTKLRPRDVFDATGEAYPADADLWNRLSEEMKKEGKKGYLIASLTCNHNEEGYSLKK